ncbi:Acetylglutamate kinase [Dissostichus eleginoides]|uniref:Acetylglutamate kinase n=1 Tax=Dissostichus eleginoides TaxID=100907 RepID=A0AAD9F9Z4_DISEL|nr:Acetylglutamate kinase [Dissostichus eleginoides]
MKKWRWRMQAGDGRIVDMTGKGEKGRQEVWLINSEGEFSVAGLLRHVGDQSLCPGLQLQRSLISLPYPTTPKHL